LGGFQKKGLSEEEKKHLFDQPIKKGVEQAQTPAGRGTTLWGGGKRKETCIFKNLLQGGGRGALALKRVAGDILACLFLHGTRRECRAFWLLGIHGPRTSSSHLKKGPDREVVSKNAKRRKHLNEKKNEGAQKERS